MTNFSLLNFLPHFFEANFPLEIETFSIKGLNNLKLVNPSQINLSILNDQIDTVFKYDGLIFIKEPSGKMITSLDEVFRDYNYYGFYIRDNKIKALSKDAISNFSMKYKNH